MISKSQILLRAIMVAVASQYIAPAWRGAIAVALVWFVDQCKTKLFTSALASWAFRNIAGNEHELLFLHKILFGGLFVVGLMALVEHYRVAMHAVLMVHDIGGVATAIAFGYIIGDVLNVWLDLQISKQFSVGDTIKVGFVEGQVVEIGLATTTLLSTEKLPIRVPNSLFHSQVIQIKSLTCCCAMVTKIHLHTDDFGEIRLIPEDIKSMLRSYSMVFLEKEPPYGFRLVC